VVIHIGLVFKRVSLCATMIESKYTDEVDLGLVAHIPNNLILVDGLACDRVFQSYAPIKVITSQSVNHAFNRSEGAFMGRKIASQDVNWPSWCVS
jgi:hypothetical protein